jgi:hypothetical protein
MAERATAGIENVGRWTCLRLRLKKSSMDQSDHFKLLHGPYRAPALKRGDRATCLYRDTDVIVTSWSAGRISWPRCRALDQPIGGSGLLVDEELARAVRCESSLAIRYWWGVSHSAVHNWRKALGVDRLATEGSQRLHRLVSKEGGAALQRKFAALSRKPTPPRQRRPWTAAQDKLV